MESVMQDMSNMANFEINIGEFFLAEVAQSTDDETKKYHALEHRIAHVVVTLNKCAKINNQRLSELDELIRNEISIKYSPEGSAIAPQQYVATSFKVSLQISAANWRKYTETCRSAHKLCKKYSSDQIQIFLSFAN